MRRLAIDPGEKHVGWARENSQGVISAGEWPADKALDQLAWLLRWEPPSEVIVEEFVLYPHESGAQAWKKMKTSEMIGAIKLLCKQLRVPVIEQKALIKKPTRKQLPARGIKQVGSGSHARDAELHLYYRKLREDTPINA